MEYFTQNELKTFSDCAGRPYAKNNEEDKIKFSSTRTLYNKLGHLAKQIQESAFPEGKTKIIRNPLNTNGTVFMRYLWAQVYPTHELAKEKTLAFTVSVDSANRIDVKIDTVGLNEDHPLRIKYLKWRGEYNTSPIVKSFSFDEALSLNWDKLTKEMAKSMTDMLDDYYKFREMMKSGESAPSKIVTAAYPLNQILYGPPGTGKTYLTKNLAVQILNGNTNQEREAIKRQYDDLYKQGRIRFMTFHQGTTYEDFIEGIKPILDSDQEEEESTISYVIEDGVFKRMCVEASQEYVKLQSQEQSSAKTLTFSQLYDELVSQFEERIENGEKVSIPQKSGSPIHVVGTSSKGNLLLKHEDGQREYTASKSRLEKLFNAIDDFDNLPNIYSFFRKVIGGSNASANWAVLNQIYKLKKKHPQDSKEAPQKTISYADKLRAFERIDWNKVDPAQRVPKYLLIIDEINRGNVAAVLGELITLLESDKRGGAKESLEVTLPYSKSNFAVPPNLYLIGTMNTADRSVEALDTALRRRFSFTEVGPQPELLSPKAMIVNLLNMEAYADLDWEEEPYHAHASNLYAFLGVDRATVEDPIKDSPPDNGERAWEENDLEHLNAGHFTGVQLDSMLDVINSRIRKLIDKDHMIGHAYFMGIAANPDPWQALKEVFHRNILPLLQEYFFGDFGKIGLVLGGGFVKVEEGQNDGAFADFPYEAGADISAQSQYFLEDVSRMEMPAFQAAVRNILPVSNTSPND